MAVSMMLARQLLIQATLNGYTDPEQTDGDGDFESSQPSEGPFEGDLATQMDLRMCLAQGIGRRRYSRRVPLASYSSRFPKRGTHEATSYL
jgi:hypothetical protein